MLNKKPSYWSFAMWLLLGATACQGVPLGAGNTQNVEDEESTSVQPLWIIPFEQWSWNSTGRLLDDNSPAWLADADGKPGADLIAVGDPNDPYNRGNAGWLYVASSNGTGFPTWTWSSGTPLVNKNDKIWLVDVNGDKKADLVVQGKAGGTTGVTQPGWLYVALNDGTGKFPLKWSWNSNGIMFHDSDQIWIADVDGKNGADIVAMGGPGNTNVGVLYVALNDGTGKFPTWWNWISPNRVVNDNDTVLLADVDGKNGADLVVVGGAGSTGATTAGYLYMALSNGTATLPIWTWKSTSRVVNDNDTVLLADVDGKNGADLVAVGAAGSKGVTTEGYVYVYTALASLSGRFPGWTWTSSTYVIIPGTKIWLADVDGDHKMDLVADGAPGATDAGFMYVGLSNGKGFPSWTWSSYARVLLDNDTAWLADVNGDGRADLVAESGPEGGTPGSIWVGLHDPPPAPPSGDLADSVVLITGNAACSGTLLTNNWVLTAQHCRSQNPLPMVEYNLPCTKDADCSARGGTCITFNGLPYCGANVALQCNNPDSDPNCAGCADQVNLWQLSKPILSGLRSGPYSIAQPVWYGTPESLYNSTITILGSGGTRPVTQMGTFKITGPDLPYPNDWGYLIQPLKTAWVIGGDSGGPGYLAVNGVNYLTGTTITTTTQHDLSREAAWLDQLLFDLPRPIRKGVTMQGFAMALNASGAVQAFVQSGYVYYSQCDSEPCDSRGAWSTPYWCSSSGGATAAPAIASDTVGAQVFVPKSTGMYALHLAKDNRCNEVANLGGSCAGPAAASTRPNTNPPVIDLACVGRDGKVYLNTRKTGWSGFGAIQPPSPGILAGTAPAIVSTSPTESLLVVVGNDGVAYYNNGSNGVWQSWSKISGLEGTLRSVAIASYRAGRYDVVAVDSLGVLHHKIYEGGWWPPAWATLGRGYSATVPPFAASFSGKLGLINVGGVDTSYNAQIQRYSDWKLLPGEHNDNCYYP